MPRRRAKSLRPPPAERPLPKPGRKLTIIAQDPSLKVESRILTATLTLPNESLSAGPRGYRVQVVDYDATANQMYQPLNPALMGTVEAPRDPYGERLSSPAAFNRRLLEDPRFHAQNGTEVPRDKWIRALKKDSLLRSTQELEQRGELVMLLEYDL